MTLCSVRPITHPTAFETMEEDQNQTFGWDPEKVKLALNNAIWMTGPPWMTLAQAEDAACAAMNSIATTAHNYIAARK